MKKSNSRKPVEFLHTRYAPLERPADLTHSAIRNIAGSMRICSLSSRVEDHTSTKIANEDPDSRTPAATNFSCGGFYARRCDS